MTSVDIYCDSGAVAGSGGALADASMTAGRLPGGLLGSPLMHDALKGASRSSMSNPAATSLAVLSQPQAVMRAQSVSCWLANFL